MHTPTPFAALEKRAYAAPLISKGLGAAGGALGKGIGALGGLLGRGVRAAGGMIGRNPVKSLLGGSALYGAAQSAPGQGLMDTAAGKINAMGADATKGLASTWAALGAGAKALTGKGSWSDVGNAANNTWNQYGQYADQQRARADKGWNSAAGYGQGAMERFSKPFAMAGAGMKGFQQGGWTGMGQAMDSQAAASNARIGQFDKQVGTGMIQGAPQPPKPAPAPTPTSAAPQGGGGVMGPPAPGSLAFAPSLPGSGPMMSAVPFTPQSIAAPPKAQPVPQFNNAGNLGNLAGGQKF